MTQEKLRSSANNQTMTKSVVSPYPLIAILLLATLLRVWGLTWGLPSATHYFSYHPDESRVLQVAMFNMNLFAGKLLPHFYNYGSLQLYLVNFANSLAFLFGGVDIVPKDLPTWYPQWARMYLIGRSLTVAMGVGTVWATYALGQRLWGRRAGLLAALILAIMPLHAQHSHWLTVDVPATFWGLLALLWTARFSTEAPHPLRNALWAGVFAGLAAATKYNMAFVLVPLVVTCVLAPPGLGAGGGSRLKSLTVGLIASIAAFLIACPGAVLETGQFVADLRFEAVHVNNADDPTFKDTGSGFVYHITHNLDAGLGLPLLLLAFASVVYAVVRRERGDGLLAAFALPYYIVIGLAAVRYARYVIPLLPILALWCGRFLADLTRPSQGRVFRSSFAAMGALVLLTTLGWTVLLLLPMAQQDNRDKAMALVNADTPPPAVIEFPVQPWFGTAPVSPYFPAPQPGAWRRQTPPSVAARIAYSGHDWDVSALNTAKPALVVLSEYDYRDALRLHDPAALSYLTALRQDYVQYAVVPGYGPGLFPCHEEDGLLVHSLPHDMLYTNPEITLYQRKR